MTTQIMAAEPRAARLTAAIDASLAGVDPAKPWEALRRYEHGPDRAYIHPADPIAYVSDFSIPTPGGTVRARFYRDQIADPHLVVFFQGGGWVAGNVENDDSFCRSLVKASGCAVLSAEYRLAPENPYPAGLEDCRAVIEWAADSANDLAVADRPIVVAGESAGGNLTAAACRLLAQEGGPPIALQVLLCPPVDATRAYAQGHRQAILIPHLWAAYRGGAPSDDPHVSPLLDPEVLQLPDTVVVVAEADPLRDEGVDYAARLCRDGANVTLRSYAGQPHSFMVYGLLPAARQCLVDIGADIRKALSGADTRH